MSETSQGSGASTNHPEDEMSPAKTPQPDSVLGNPLEVFQIFLQLGLTAFGGPIAHLGISSEKSSNAGSGSAERLRRSCGVVSVFARACQLFTFSAYLGTVIGNSWLAGLWCLFWIFVPSFLLLLRCAA